MEFTELEKINLVKNTKMIFDYLKSNIIPKLEENFIFKMEVNPREIELVIHIFPKNKNNHFSIYRNRLGCTRYSLGEITCTTINDPFREQYKDFYKSYNEMFTLIKNWYLLKEKLFDQIKKDQKDRHIINTFML